MLAVARQEVVPEDRLMEGLWADDAPRTAVKSLQTHLSRLRKALADAGGDELQIETRPSGYLLRVADGATDVHVVEAMAAAARSLAARGALAAAAIKLRETLGMWRGRPLGEFADEPFATSESTRLQELRLSLLEEWVDAELACGHHAALAGELEALTAVNQFRERLWAQRMLALYRSGRQAEALRVYGDLRRMLADELGIDPSPELKALEHSMLIQAPELGWKAPADAEIGDPASASPASAASFLSPSPELSPSPAPSPSGAPELGSDPQAVAPARSESPRVTLPPIVLAGDERFVGRVGERDRLVAAWDNAVRGRRSVVLVSGEPGIGKTRLAAEHARAVAAHGATVLWGRCDEDLGFPYQPFLEPLRTYVRACSTEVLGALAGSGAADLARVVPEVADRLGLVVPVRAEPEADRYFMFEAVSAFLSAATASSPMLIVLDDLHWAGKPSLLLLRHLIRSSAPMAVMILGTYRDTELDRSHPLAEILADLRRDPAVERLVLRGLAHADVAHLLEATTGGELDAGASDLAAAVHHETGGNPFFVGEMLRHLVETGTIASADGTTRLQVNHGLGLPEGLREVITRRLSRLSPAANRALTVASVVGPTFSLRLIEAIGDTDPDELLDSLDEAVTAQVLVEDPDRRDCYTFGHALIRQTLLAELSAARRMRLHRRVGEALEAASDPDGQLDALAYHFAEAALDGQVAKASHYALAAGRRSLDRLALEEAVRHLERGLAVLELDPEPDLARRADLQLALAEARSGLGDLAGGRVTALKAAADAHRLASPERLGKAAVQFARMSTLNSPNPVATALCDEALTELGEQYPAVRARLLAAMAHEQYYARGDRLGAGPVAERAIEVARVSGDPDALAEALFARAETLVGSAEATEQLALAEQIVSVAEGTGDARTRTQGLVHRAIARLTLGDGAGFDADTREIRRLGASLRLLSPYRFTSHLAAMRALLDGRFDEVKALADASFALSRPDDAEAMNVYGGQLFVLYREQGQLQELLPVLSSVAAEQPHVASYLSGVALVEAEMGLLDDSRLHLSWLADDWFTTARRDFAWIGSVVALSETCSTLGDAARSATLYDLFLPHAGQLAILAMVACYGAVDRYLAMLATTMGRHDEAQAHFEAALQLEEGVGSRPLLARTRYWYARLLIERGGPGDRDRAGELLTSVVSETEALGMAALNQAAAALAAG
jgi:DNA-binding SARP family transcriptional activator/tetratricopeptide (TPR) repeat protein